MSAPREYVATCNRCGPDMPLHPDSLCVGCGEFVFHPALEEARLRASLQRAVRGAGYPESLVETLLPVLLDRVVLARARGLCDGLGLREDEAYRRGWFAGARHFMRGARLRSVRPAKAKEESSG